MCVLLKIPGCETQCATEHPGTKTTQKIKEINKRIKPKRVITTLLSGVTHSAAYKTFDITSGNHSPQLTTDMRKRTRSFVPV